MGEGHVMHGTGYYQWTDKVSYKVVYVVFGMSEH